MIEPELLPITKQDEAEFDLMKPAKNVMPLKVGRNERAFTYVELSLSCIKCQASGPENVFMGNATVIGNEGVQINCVKACPTCRLASLYIFRFYPEGFVTQILPNGGIRAYQLTTPPAKRFARDVVRSILKLLLPFSNPKKR